MKKLLASLITVTLLGAVYVSPAQAAPKPKKYANCAAVLKVFPAGVAKTQAAARVAVADGKARPTVNKKTYDLNAKKLDRNGNLVICEQTNAATEPEPETPAPVNSVIYISTGIPLYDALNLSKAKAGSLTQTQANALTAIGNVVVSPTQNARTRVCPFWSLEAFRTSFIDSAIVPASLAALKLSEGESTWAKENLTLAVSSYCAQVS